MDKIAQKAIKEADKANAKWLLGIFNKALKHQSFPSEQEVAKFELVLKELPATRRQSRTIMLQVNQAQKNYGTPSTF